jgi:cellulose synthase/poly-beta-1,6-N-acetylglucosamine synthase-like glycosyltransferase
VSGDVVLVGDRAMLRPLRGPLLPLRALDSEAGVEIGSMIGADGALYAIRRNLFVAPPTDTILDDMAIRWPWSATGYRTVMEPRATAHEQGVTSAKEEFLRKSRVVAGAIQFLSRTDSSVPIAAPQVMLAVLSHKALRWLSPVFGLATFVCSVAVAPSSAFFATVAFASSGCWASASPAVCRRCGACR